MRVGAVLFDKDGTLFDFQKTWAGSVSELINGHAGDDSDLAADLAGVLGFDLVGGRFHAHSLVISSTAFEMAEALLRFFPGQTTAELVADLNRQAEMVEQVEVLPLPPFLDSIRSFDLKTGIATNDSESAAMAHLEQFEIAEKFDYVAGYDSGFGAKPDPGMCTAFSAHVGIAPERVAMIGDSLHDLHAGRAAGMQCVAVLTGVATADVLAPHADVVLPDIGHLVDWLQS